MGHINVDIVHAEAGKALVDLVTDGIRGEILIKLHIADLVEQRALAVPDDAELGDDAHFFPVHVLEGLADDDFAVAEVIAGRGVEHIDAGLRAGADGRNAVALRFGLLRRILPPCRAAADGPRAKADPGNGFFNRTDLDVFHCASPK